MSKREEEQGTLVLPSAAVIPLRRALVEAMNAQRQRARDWAARAYAHLQSQDGQAQRQAINQALRTGPDARPSADDLLGEVVRRVNNARGEPGEPVFQAARLLLPFAPWPRPANPRPRRLQAPKKKDLPPLPAQTWQFQDEGAAVRIDPEKRTLSWEVDRSNRAVEHAWAGPLGRALQAALDKVEWTRATGGVFRYADEYADEAAMEHGGNPVRISRAFGPLGEEEQARAMGVSLARYRTMMSIPRRSWSIGPGRP